MRRVRCVGGAALADTTNDGLSFIFARDKARVRAAMTLHGYFCKAGWFSLPVLGGDVETTSVSGVHAVFLVARRSGRILFDTRVKSHLT